MQDFQSSNQVLVISNDNFIIGLLTGYCVANSVALKTVPFSKLINKQDINSKFKLIIIDIRKVSPLLTEIQLERIKEINLHFTIPVCAIHHSDGKPIFKARTWVDYYRDDIFFDKLDNYINKYLVYFNSELSERRKQNRRIREDRRKVLGFANNFTTYPINKNTGLMNQDIQNDILGVFEIDRNSKAVFFKGKNLELTGKEYKLFNLLAHYPKRVCSTESIIQHLWPDRERANKSDLYQYMHLLRRKVEKNPDDPHWIVTIKGVGYKLLIDDQ